MSDISIPQKFQLLGQWIHSVDVPNVNFLNLSVSQLMIIGRNLTTSASVTIQIQCSVDNGSSFYSANGDYVSIASTGVETNQTNILTHSTATTTARSLVGQLLGLNVNGVSKMGINSAATRLFVASLLPVNAIKISLSAAGNLTGGTIRIYGA